MMVSIRLPIRPRLFVVSFLVLLAVIFTMLIKMPTQAPLAAASQEVNDLFGHTFLIQQEISFPVSFNAITQMVHDPVHNRLYALGIPNYLFAIDLTTGTVSELPNMPPIVSWIAVSEDGQRLYVNYNGISIRIYNTSNWNSFITINYGAGELATVDNHLFALTSSNLLVFDAITGTYIETFTIPGGNSYSDMVVSSDHNILYLHGASTLHKLNISSSPITQLLYANVAAAANSLSISSDGSQLILTHYPSNSLYRYSSDNFALLDTLPGFPDEFIRDAIYTDAMLVGAYAFLNSGPTLRGFDTVDGQASHYFGVGNYDVTNNVEMLHTDLEALDNGRLAVSVRVNGFPKIWIMAPTYYGVAMPLAMRDYCLGPYVDDFSNPNSGWPRGSSGSMTYNYVNNEYQMLHGVSDQWFAVSRGDRFVQENDWEQYLEVDTSILNGQNGIIGIVWGLNENWSDFYTFELWPNEQYWLLFHYNAASGWQLLTYGNSSFINRTGTNKISMYATHFSSYLYQFQVNDYYIVERPAVMGRVGISSSAFDNNTLIAKLF